jgi:hypothetical protein
MTKMIFKSHRSTRPSDESFDSRRFADSERARGPLERRRGPRTALRADVYRREASGAAPGRPGPTSRAGTRWRRGWWRSPRMFSCGALPRGSSRAFLSSRRPIPHPAGSLPAIRDTVGLPNPCENCSISSIVWMRVFTRMGLVT